MTITLRRLLIPCLLMVVVLFAMPARAGQQPPVGDPQSEFVPLRELPPQDQLPAAPLLVTAYAFVLVALFVYLLSVARRLQGVRQEVARLEADLKRSGRVDA